MIVKRLRLAKICTTLLLVMCSLTLITSPWGNKVIIKLINQMEGVSLRYKEGSLLTALAFHEIKVTLDTGELTLNKVDASLDFWCSMQGKLCFNKLTINALELALAPNNDKKTSLNSVSDPILSTLDNFSTFNSPIGIEVKNSSINSSILNIYDMSLVINTINAHITLEKDQLTIISGTINNTIINANANQTNDHTLNTSRGGHKESYQQVIKRFQQAILAKSPQINLPIALAIKKLSISHLSYQHGIIKNKINKGPSWNFSNTDLSASWNRNKLHIKQFSTAMPELTIPSLTLKTNLKSPYELSTSIDIASINSNHWPAIKDTVLQLSMQGDINTLTAKLTSKGEIDFRGNANIALTNKKLPFNLQFSTNNISLPSLVNTAKTSYKAKISSLLFTGNIDQQSLNLQGKIYDYDTEEASVNLTAKQADGLIKITKLQIENQNTKSKLLMYGQINEVDETLQWQLFAESPGFELPTFDLKVLIAQLNKQLTNSIVNNSPNSSNTKIYTVSKVHSPSHAKKIVLPPYFPDIIEGRLVGNIVSKGNWQASKWSVAVNDINLTGTINDKALIIKGNIETNQLGFLSAMPGNSGELSVKLAQDYLKLQATETSHEQIDISFGIDQISYWYPPVKGSIDGSLIIKGDKKNPKFTFNTKAYNVNWQKLYSPTIEISGLYKPLDNHQMNLTLKAVDLIVTKKTEQQKQNNITVNSVNAVLSGNMTEQQLDIHWQGDIGGALLISGQNKPEDSKPESSSTKNKLPKNNLPKNNLAKRNESNLAEQKWLGTIKRAHLHYKDAQWKIDKAINFQVNINKQQLQLDSHCWLGSGLSLCLPTKSILNNWGKSGQLALKLRQDLSTLNQFALPQKLTINSILSGEISTKWSPQQNLTAQANFILSSGDLSYNSQYQQELISQWQRGQLTLDLNNKKLITTLRIDKANNYPLINASASVHFTEQLALNGSIELNQFSLQPLQVFIDNVADLKGHVSSKLNISGTLNKPIINGSLSLVEGALLLNQSPNQLASINSAIEIKQNQATVQGDFKIEGKQGNFTGELSWQNKLLANIDLYAVSLPLIFPPQLVAEVSPAINISLTNNHMMISGNIDVLAGSYNIEKLPQGSINLSKDVVFVDNQGKKIISPTPHLKLTTDIKINTKNSFKVYGQGLQAELRGQLALKQKVHQPLQVFGKIQSQQGSYQAYGQKLTIEQGDLSFNGAVTNPYINLRASRYINADNLTVGIDITGLANVLSMQLFSKPTLENAEILSFLTRGRGLDGENNNANAAASMLIGIGLSNSTQIFEQLEKIPLINNITLDTEGSDDNTQAVISGYVGDRIYLKYGIGVFEPINELTVRLYLLNRLWVEVVSGLEQSGDIYYSFDID